MLAGAQGPAAAAAMGLLARFAEAVQAPHLLDAEAAHIDGCLYHGQVSLDFIDLCCALTGRVPAYGLHLPENRRARVVVEVVDLPREWEEAEVAGLACVAVGHLVGRRCGERIPAIVGLPSDTGEDELKALGAVAASSGAVAMFHAVGLTPEAPTLEAALGGEPPEEAIRLGREELRATLAGLERRGWAGRLRAVIDRVFLLMAEPFALTERGGHFGKIAVSLS